MASIYIRWKGENEPSTALQQQLANVSERLDVLWYSTYRNTDPKGHLNDPAKLRRVIAVLKAQDAHQRLLSTDPCCVHAVADDLIRGFHMVEIFIGQSDWTAAKEAQLIVAAQMGVPVSVTILGATPATVAAAIASCTHMVENGVNQVRVNPADTLSTEDAETVLSATELWLVQRIRTGAPVGYKSMARALNRILERSQTSALRKRIHREAVGHQKEWVARRQRIVNGQ